jgi:hypothetical protein
MFQTGSKRHPLVKRLRRPGIPVALLSLLALVGAAAGRAPAASTDLSVERLQEDVTYLQARLPEVHAEFDKIIARPEWDRRCEQTRADLPRLRGAARALRVAGLVASLGVAHTRLESGGAPFRILPIRLMALSDGLFVTAAATEHRDLARARVLAVGGRPAVEAVERLGGLSPSENSHWRRVSAGGWSAVAEACAAVGLAEPDGRVLLRLRLANGKVAERTLEGTVTPAPVFAVLPQDRLPEYVRRETAPYRITVDAETKTLILDYRRCQPDPDRPMALVTEEFWKMFHEGGCERVAVDLRRNGGGNSGVLFPFLASLRKRPELARKGRLFAFISAETFSSGMMNALDLRRLGARLVGEPTGGSPNSYGELKSFDLPHSRLRVTYCTKLFRLVPAADAVTVEPDWPAPIRWSDLAEGRDACLEEVRRRTRPRPLDPLGR